MPTFVHLADIHLGSTVYSHPERGRDFFRAFYGVIRKHIIPNHADFVLIVGDLFDKRTVDPTTLNQAILALSELKEAGVPVLAIEGNHDSKRHGEQITWIRFLCEQGLLCLLEPEYENGEMILSPWNDTHKDGGYIDIAGVRIIGSQWYGSSTARIIEPFARAIEQLPPAPYTILMLHLGMEGYLSEHGGGISYSQLAPLKGLVNYLALGHIHKRYQIDHWVFNPGSLESYNVSESDEPKGAFLVKVDGETQTVEPITDYPTRPFARLRYDISLYTSPKELFDGILDRVSVSSPGPFPMKPVVEIVLHGQLRFKRHEIDMKTLKRKLEEILESLVLLLKLEAIPVEYAVVPEGALTMDRRELEMRVIRDLIARDARYQPQASQWADLILTLKRMALRKEDPKAIYLTLKEQMESLMEKRDGDYTG